MKYLPTTAADRDFIEGNLALDSNRHGRNGVTLTDKEAMILGALTQAADLPFNPRKRVYLYSEAAHPSGNRRTR